ncbi:BlaI/MecI/CopY family transcriptional regulator [uncultured Alistipes sp.]|uniref:BlaI/MecI/CopY family transcriptional regulator n=1 Tax=uncultured Alistipes sp. TaxID=538949 RepID=UPI00272A89CE|nr:BlaI/MecI/CopY family transcriptional regulator [uncultured Alistipes sp.]
MMNHNEKRMNNERQIQALTRGEEEVMRILWQLGDAVVNGIIDRMPEPRPKYTTVATFLKILETKGFVAHTAEGKSHRYYPLVDRETYARSVMSSMLTSYFDGSLVQLVSFFSRHEKISAAEQEEILEIVRNAKKSKS